MHYLFIRFLITTMLSPSPSVAKKNNFNIKNEVLILKASTLILWCYKLNGKKCKIKYHVEIKCEKM